MNVLATSLQTYFTTFAHTQRDLSANTITSYRDTWRMLLKYLTSTLKAPANALDFDAITAANVTGSLDHLEQPGRPLTRQQLRPDRKTPCVPPGQLMDSHTARLSHAQDSSRPPGRCPITPRDARLELNRAGGDLGARRSGGSSWRCVVGRLCPSRS